MPSEISSRLAGRLQRIGDLLLALLQNRLELLGVELQQELQRLLAAVARAALALLLIGLGLFFAVALLVVLFWDDHRLWVLGGAAALFLLLGVWLIRDAATRLQPREGGLFAASVDELGRDRAAIGAAPASDGRAAPTPGPSRGGPSAGPGVWP